MTHKLSLGFLLGLGLSLASCKSSTAPPETDPISGGNDILVAGTHALVLASGSNTLYLVDLSQMPASDRAFLMLSEGNFGKTNSTLDAVLLPLNGTDTILQPNIIPDSTQRILAGISMGLDAPNKMALIAPNSLLVTRRNTTSAAIVDLNSSKITDSIPLGGVSIAVAVLNNKAYVTTGVTEDGGPYHLSIVDLATNKVTTTIPLPESPEQALPDSATGYVIIGTSGDGSTTSGELYFVNATTDIITDSLTPGTPADDPELTTGGKHFIIIGANVYPLTVPSHVLASPIISGATTYYKGMYDAASDALYLGNAGDYANPGTVDVYSASSGTLLWSRPAGIIPGHFAFYH